MMARSSSRGLICCHFLMGVSYLLPKSYLFMPILNLYNIINQECYNLGAIIIKYYGERRKEEGKERQKVRV